MFRHMYLLASGVLLLFTPVTTPQEPKSVQEALAQLAKIDGRVNLDQRKVVIEIDV